jgi:hypothetical protein
MHVTSTQIGIFKKKIVNLVFILHLPDGHRELGHCPAECIEKSIKKGKEQLLFMNTCLPQ